VVIVGRGKQDKDWSRIFEQNSASTLPGLGCRAERQLGEVDLIGRGAAKALMWALAIGREDGENAAMGF
jgi:hypothetical protein